MLIRLTVNFIFKTEYLLKRAHSMHSSGVMCCFLTHFSIWSRPTKSVSQNLPVLDLCEVILWPLKEIILNTAGFFFLLVIKADLATISAVSWCTATLSQFY